MKINEIISEARYTGFNQQQLDFEKSKIDYQELNLLKQYKEELLQKLEQRGISPDLVGRGVTLDPPDNLSLQDKLDIYNSQCEAMKNKLKSDSKSFVQPGQQFQLDKKKMKQRSGPVKTMTGQEYMAQKDTGKV